MKFLIRTLILIASFTTYVTCMANEETPVFEVLPEFGTEKNPLIIDVESSDNLLVSTSAKSGTAYVLIKNMNPMFRESYSIKINQTITAPTPLVRPVAIAEDKQVKTSDNGTVKSAIRMKKPDPCEDVKKLIQKIQKSKSEDKISPILTELKSKSEVGDEECRKLNKDMVGRSEFRVKFNVEAGTKTTISVSLNDKKHSAEIEVKPVEWVTHVGFTFADNMDKTYYSKLIPASGTSTVIPEHFIVAPQSNDGNIDYAATILFTYPIGPLGDTVKHGPTFGLAADTNTIGVVAGYSLILNHNVLLTTGVEVKQFEDLKGIYEKGQNIGANAIDSSALAEKQFKAAFMISLGYKFN